MPAGLFVGNGYGKLIGATQLIALPDNETMLSVNPVVGETNDGFLSDIRARPITEQDVLDALHGATGGSVAEGCVGAGTGTTALGFKAGMGTSSRIVEVDGIEQPATVSVLVQANFGGTLTVLGVPIGSDQALLSAGLVEPNHEIEQGNSCMIIVATDAPLNARQLRRLATRAVFGMGRVGSDFTHGSGDYGIAFSVGEGTRVRDLSLIHISEPTRRTPISYA